MPDPIPPQYLATAIEAVIHAGDVQLSRFGTDIRVDKKGAIDLVTEIDIQIEREFRAMIAGRFPDHVVLGEEFSSRGDRDVTPPFCWVFDPVDGTTNYAHGLPIFCSSLALEIEGEIAVGAVYDPTRRELFTAERGQGAWLNGQPLRVSAADELIDSLLVTGFHYGIQRDPEDLVGLFREFIAKSRAVRRLGSAALDLAYVACGRVDAFWERGLNSWDMAAGLILVREAGGFVSDADGGGDPIAAGSVACGNDVLHRELLDLLKKAKRAA